MVNLHLKLKLANTFATLLLIGVQCFSYSRWFTGHDYGLEHRDFAIGLLALLQFLLIGMTIYQWLPSSPKDTFAAIGYWYLLVAVLHGAAAVLWFFSVSIFAFVVFLWQSATLVFLYKRLGNYPPQNKVDMTFLNAPFSIYFAYTVFVTSLQIRQFIDNTIVRTLIIIFDGFVALHLVDYSHRQDWVVALSTAWLLLDAEMHSDDIPHTVALVTAGVLVSGVARVLIPQWLERINPIHCLYKTPRRTHASPWPLMLIKSMFYSFLIYGSSFLRRSTASLSISFVLQNAKRAKCFASGQCSLE